MMNVFTQAVHYVDRCKWSVIPLKPNSKSPLIPWQEFQERFPTAKELKIWFQGTQNNIGIVTGSISGISVIDVDQFKLPSLIENLYSSIHVLTKKGHHLYFKYSGETNSVSKIAEHIDVRGEGGYVVAPSSVVDGHRYRFCSPYVSPNLLRPFPRGLLDAVSRDVQQPKPQDWISEALNSLSEGNRNATFTQIVGRLHRDGHSTDTISSLLAPHAERAVFDLVELNNVIQSVTRYQNDGQTTGYENHTQGNQGEDIEDFLKGDEKVSWIVPSVIARNSIGFVAGLPETYKTWILADLAIESAKGGSWLRIPVKQTKTLFIDQERFKGETRRRFKKMMKAKGITGKDIKGQLYIQVGTSIRLNIDESFEAFRRKLAEIKPELVIVDSFATFSTVAENDRQEVQKVLERVKQLRQEFGCSFIFIDHEGKSVLNPDNQGEMPDAFKLVGSVGKVAAAETVLTVRKDNANSVTIYHTKSSLAPAIAPISVQIIDTDNDGIKLAVL